MRIVDVRTRKTELASADFVCPCCDAPRPYRHVRAGRIAHVYGLPLLPVGRPVEYLECGSCEATFDARILEASAEELHEIAAVYEEGMLRVMAATVLARGEDVPPERIAAVFAGLSGVELADEDLYEALEVADARRGALWRYLERLEPHLNDTGKERVVHAALFVAARDGKLERWAARHVRRVARSLGIERDRLRGIVASLPA